MHAMNITTDLAAADPEATRLDLAQQLDAAETAHERGRRKLAQAADKAAANLDKARAAMEQAAQAHQAAAAELARADASHRHRQTRLQSELRALTPSEIQGFVKQCHDEAEQLP